MKPSICVATPVYGSPVNAFVNVSHHHTIAGLCRDPHFTLAPASFGTDIVRARSRLVRQFLDETAYSHLLFWDADVTCASVEQAGRLIRRLVESERPIIGCTYPMKRIQWGKAAEAVHEGKDPRAGAYDYPLHLAADTRVENGCLRVDGVPLGFCMITRETLETMVSHYGHSLTFEDTVEGVTKATVALFQLTIVRSAAGLRELWSEDYSFCHRAKEIGLQSWLYCGPDCELTHVGLFAFEGRRDGFVR